MFNQNQKQHDISKEHIAYFTMEVGISHSLPTYSGGLGVLAGDILKSFADTGIPVVGVTMLNERGYFYQRIDEHGNQMEDPVQWNVAERMVPLPNEAYVEIEGRRIKIRAWRLMVHGLTGHQLPVLFLDTNLPENSDFDRTLTSVLYGGDRYYRLCQEIVLGIGGTRMLESLGYQIKKYHMNEGHAALLTIELLRKMCHDAVDDHGIQKVREKCVFTTHTPVAAGHDHFEIGMFKKALDGFVPESLYAKITQENEVNMTLLALVMSHYVNGVAKRHKDITEEMFPEFQIDSITNGVHSTTWTNDHFKQLYDTHIPGWAIDPYTLRYAMSIDKEKIWDAHYAAKRELIDYVNTQTNGGFHVDRFTIGYARRFTAYKRPDLILYDIERLKRIAEEKGDIQIIFAGKAHSKDMVGKEVIRRVIELSRQLQSQGGRLRILFLPQYDMLLAKRLVSGCDVWLNTPQRPYEASGTSGMKAAINGVPHFSTIDGWWLEGRIEGETGWSIGAHPHDPDFDKDIDAGKDADDLYRKLEEIIVPTFYGNRKRWMEIMRHCISMNASFFNTHRVTQQYIANAYRQ